MNIKPVAVITGANRGIGRGIALSLAKDGYDIVGISRTLVSKGNKKGLKDLKAEIKAIGADFLPIESDISDIDYHKKILSEIKNELGRIDILVNNAGVAPEKRLDVLETSPASYDRVMSINLRSAFFLSQLFAKEMLKHIDKIPDYNPKIVFITSVSAETSSPNRAEYCISKAGMSMASKIFADRLAESGINVYEIRPGIIETDMTAPVKAKYDEMIKEGLIPQYRWGTPDDVAKAVTAITSGNFDYSSGMVFEVSGGMNIQRL
ncbi:MAG: 3-ketoacyl-ACP reductase [bacterium]|nr:3-ketoacyl-ACP reductase [bacterium]